MRILVTGASGFVGSHIVETLLEAKHSVICAVRKTSNLRWVEDLPVKYRYGDLNDEKFSETVVKNVSAVIHCAGIVRAMNKNEYFKANAENTKNLCNAVLKVNPGLKKFIFISSQSAMGPSAAEGVEKVTDENNPISDYGLSKLAAESEVKKILCGKVPYTILRPSTVYDPRDKDIFIFFYLINKHLRLVTMTKRFLQLIYVKDVANTVTSCLENEKTDNNVYYLANSIVYTWSEIGKIISSSVGIKTVPVPVADFVFKFVAIAAESLSYITKKPAVLNRQKVVEMLQEYWTSSTKPAKNDLNIEFTSLEVASEITYNWYSDNRFF